MSFYLTEPLDMDQPDTQREDEALREQRWAEFVTWCRGDRPKSASEWATLVNYIHDNMKGHGDWHHEAINRTICDFAQDEGWSGVLIALGRAMRPDTGERGYGHGI